MTEKIFAYCERGLDPSFWAEPLNALTNAAFIVAGGVALALNLRDRRQTDDLDPVPTLLAGVVIVIGLGSFLFHTIAERWSSLADVIPIGIFMLVYFAFAMRRYFGLGLGWSAVATLAFAVAIGLAQSSRALNGSVGYLPALLAMMVVGGIMVARRAGVARFVFAAAAVFMVSLTLRSLDRSFCDSTALFGAPIGTHFLWHLLNATTLYLLLHAARIQHQFATGAAH